MYCTSVSVEAEVSHSSYVYQYLHVACLPGEVTFVETAEMQL